MATGMERTEPPLIVIVGPTASGKSALAIDVAERHKGEIICADSRTVYREMNIGTAKPSVEDQKRVPHWGIDLINPGERYTAADFKAYAKQKIAEIRERGRVPILVGGTGLYVNGVVLDYQFGDDRDEAVRTKLELLSTDDLYTYCVSNNIELPKNDKNRRHLIRAIEQKSINTKRRDIPLSNTIVVGIATDREKLKEKIRLRIEHMLSDGVVEEAIRLGKKYGWENESMTGNVYRYIAQSTDRGRVKNPVIDVAKIATLDARLAKKQMTWFRRNPYINWGSIEQIKSYIDDAINSSMVK